MPDYGVVKETKYGFVRLLPQGKGQVTVVAEDVLLVNGVEYKSVIGRVARYEGSSDFELSRDEGGFTYRSVFGTRAGSFGEDLTDSAKAKLEAEFVALVNKWAKTREGTVALNEGEVDAAKDEVRRAEEKVSAARAKLLEAVEEEEQARGRLELARLGQVFLRPRPLASWEKVAK